MASCWGVEGATELNQSAFTVRSIVARVKLRGGRQVDDELRRSQEPARRGTCW